MVKDKILFVWDFHGVLEKDNVYAVKEVCDRVFKKFEIKKCVTIDKIKSLYGLKWANFYKNILLNTDDKTILEMVNYSIEIGVNAAKKHIKPMDGAKHVLKKIKEKNHENIIISNTKPEPLNSFVDFVGISELIDKCIGADAHDPKTKSPKTKSKILRDYLEKNEFKKIIVIGDTEDDIKAGLDNNATTYLFSTDKKRTSITKAHNIISDLREILKEIN